MTEDHEERGDAPRRRRGTRGGRGRGGRSTEAENTGTNGASNGSTGMLDGIDAPRIVGRRPGRAATSTAAPTAEPEAPAASIAPTPNTNIAPAAPEPVEAPRRTTRRAAPAVPPETALDSGSLAAALAEQMRLIEALRDEVRDLSGRVERSARRARLGVFVDVPNLLYGAERGERIDMGKLLEYLSTDRDLVRATAYAPVSDNPNESIQQQRFVAPFVPYEYRIVTKALKRFADGSIKGNFDVEMAVDMLSMVDRLDVMAIVSGDADFAKVVEEAQSRGVRVEVIAFAGSTSAEMRALADRYIEVGGIAHLLR